MTELVLDVVGVLIALFVAALVVGAATGRVRARSCCAVPADQDLRLRDAGRPPTG